MVQQSEIDVGVAEGRIPRQRFFVRVARFLRRVGMELCGALEPLLRAERRLCPSAVRWPGPKGAGRRNRLRFKVQQKLPGVRLPPALSVPDDDTPTVCVDLYGRQQLIGRELLFQGVKDAPDAGHRDAGVAQPFGRLEERSEEHTSE